MCPLDFAHVIQPGHKQKSSDNREPCTPSPDDSRGKRLADGRLKKESQRAPEMLKNNSQANQKCSEQKCSIATLCRHPVQSHELGRPKHGHPIVTQSLSPKDEKKNHGLCDEPARAIIAGQAPALQSRSSG